MTPTKEPSAVVEIAAEQPQLTLRHVEFDPLGWQLWSKDKGFQIAGFATREDLNLFIRASDRCRDAILNYTAEPGRAVVEQIADTPGAGLLSEDESLRQLGLLYNHAKDDSRQFTRWQMLEAMAHGFFLASEKAPQVSDTAEPGL